MQKVAGEEASERSGGVDWGTEVGIDVEDARNDEGFCLEPAVARARGDGDAFVVFVDGVAGAEGGDLLSGESFGHWFFSSQCALWPKWLNRLYFSIKTYSSQ